MRTLPLFTCLVLALAGCDSVGIDDPTCTTCDPADGGGDGDGGDGGSAALAIDVDPTQTYLYTFEDVNEQSPAVSLDDLGVGPGDSVCFEVEGDYLYAPGASARDFGGAVATGVFSSSGELLPPYERYRVVGAIDAGDDIYTGNTYRGDKPTDIDEDFDVTDACVTVPAGAKYLFFSPYDNYFQDNTGVEGEPFRVVVTS